MPVHLVRDRAIPALMAEILEHFPAARMVKIAVDVRQCEHVLLSSGSEQDDVWGANWFPDDQSIEFESLINIRPRPGNRSIVIQSSELRAAIENVTRERLGGVLP